MANSPNSSHSSHENAELLRAPPSLASSSSNEGGNTTMTEIAKFMLRSQLLYASSISERLMPNNQSNNHNNNNNNILKILDYPTLCGHRAPPHLSSSHKQPRQEARLAITYLVDGPNSNPEVQDADIDDDCDDGRIHSLPCKKNGPYTCSRCMQVFPTSQHFAAHAAADHYKYETKEQRRKRQIAKSRRRALKLQQVKDIGLTCVPIFYEWEDAGAAVLAAGNSSAEKSANGRGGGSGGGKVKEEDSAGGEVHGNDSVVPPGFEGVCIKREVSLEN